MQNNRIHKHIKRKIFLSKTAIDVNESFKCLDLNILLNI